MSKPTPEDYKRAEIRAEKNLREESEKWRLGETLAAQSKCLKTQAANNLGVDVEDIEWWSWPVSFSSTAGASGGAGGQMMSGGQCFGFMARAVTDKAIKTCDGKRWKRWSGEPGENW